MRKLVVVFSMILLIGLAPGCKDIKKIAANKKKLFQKTPVVEKPAVEFIENPELAKIILKPVAKPLTVSRDPFKPLLTKDSVAGQAGYKDLTKAKTVDILENVILVGVIKFENEYKAYLKINGKMSAYKVGDQVRDYKIAQIYRDEVLFKSETNDVVKKRGER